MFLLSSKFSGEDRVFGSKILFHLLCERTLRGVIWMTPIQVIFFNLYRCYYDTPPFWRCFPKWRWNVRIFNPEQLSSWENFELNPINCRSLHKNMTVLVYSSGPSTVGLSKVYFRWMQPKLCYYCSHSNVRNDRASFSILFILILAKCLAREWYNLIRWQWLVISTLHVTPVYFIVTNGCEKLSICLS